MAYPVLSVEDFGAQMLRTGDLDPIYVMLNGAQLDPGRMAKWCLAYWCFYHAGFASYAADAEDHVEFWDFMERAAVNDCGTAPTRDGRWPRGSERRHFRGKAGIKSVEWLRDEFRHPGTVVSWLTAKGTDFWSVRSQVMRWPAFGPWIAFKIADMLDAVMGVPVDFTGTEAAFFDDPKEGARIVNAEWVREDVAARSPAHSTNGLHGDRALDDVVKHVVYVLGSNFHDTPVPHAGRNVRTQEVETILCKYKSHTKGSYPVGKDTKEILHGLASWTDHSKTAARCFTALAGTQQGARAS